MIIILVILSVYIICGVFAYGITLNDFTTRFPSYKNQFVAIVIGAFGPIGLLVAFKCSEVKGLRLVPFTKEQRWQEFHKTYAYLGRDCFERQDH